MRIRINGRTRIEVIPILAAFAGSQIADFEGPVSFSVSPGKKKGNFFEDFLA